MFYSHQLLARKAPLGQIWMAATMHAKIHRRKLDKLDIIKICEEILNPSVPMALRLSGILMGGVVIVYERKLKLLYDDVTRLLVEINEAWKVKTVPSDSTRLPKGKSQAKYEAVTLPPNHNEDLGDTEDVHSYSNGTNMMDFQQNAYIAMTLDNVQDLYVNDLKNDQHQADAADITIFDNYNSYQANDTAFNGSDDRFDDGGIQINVTPTEYTEIPTSHKPSPPGQEDVHKSDEIQERHPEEQVKEYSDENKKANHVPKRQRIARGRRKAPAALVMDYKQNMIPGQLYQSWLMNSSNITRRRKRKFPLDSLSRMKTGILMDLPPIVLMERLVTNENGQIHYPAPLMDMWNKCIQPAHDSPSGRTSHPPPQPSSSSSPPERGPFKEPIGDPSEDIYSRDNLSRITSPERQVVWEKIDNSIATPRNSGDDGRSHPSSESGHYNILHNSDPNSGLSGKKNSTNRSGKKNSAKSLETLVEEPPSYLQDSDPNFKLAKVSEERLPPSDEPLLETGPTQTQKPLGTNQQALDRLTDSIRRSFKATFDTPGTPQAESLNHLAYGLKRQAAAALFYQTCVLATRDYVKVEQKKPYGDILIFRGNKM